MKMHLWLLTSALLCLPVFRALTATALPSDLCDYAMGQELDEAVGIRGSSVKNALVVVALPQAQRCLETGHEQAKTAPDVRSLDESAGGRARDVLPVDCKAEQLYLECALLEKIHISDHFFQVIQHLDQQGLCEATVQKFFAVQNHGISIETVRIVSNAVQTATSGAESMAKVAAYHSFWNYLIAKVLRQVVRGSSFHLNTSTSTALYYPCFEYNFDDANVASISAAMAKLYPRKPTCACSAGKSKSKVRCESHSRHCTTDWPGDMAMRPTSLGSRSSGIKCVSKGQTALSSDSASGPAV